MIGIDAGSTPRIEDVKELLVQLKKDPLCGSLYLFINKRRDRMKVLYWDGDGVSERLKRYQLEALQKVPILVIDRTSL